MGRNPRSSASQTEMSAPEGNAKSELLCAYAALLLSDCDKEINEESINDVVAAAGCDSVPAWYAAMFAKVAGMKPVKDLVESASSISAGPSSAGPAVASAGGDDAKEEEAAKESSSEEDDGAAMGMFGDDY